MNTLKKLWPAFLALFDDKENPVEPLYDPVHLAAVAMICLAVIGGLYWLLWTLLVYEGGLFLKLRAGASVLFTSKTPKDFGYEAAPYAMGAFTGWMGNLIALALTLLLVWALFHLYQETTRKHPRA